jgi:hypothetical protein
MALGCDTVKVLDSSAEQIQSERRSEPVTRYGNASIPYSIKRSTVAAIMDRTSEPSSSHTFFSYHLQHLGREVIHYPQIISCSQFRLRLSLYATGRLT